jgi:hypothetical protein
MPPKRDGKGANQSPVKTSNTFRELLAETQQGHEIRQPLYEQIERQLESQMNVKVRVLAFFTSFFWPVIIQDSDADMIEEVLRNTDIKGRELFLILNSPGGDGLAAERIVNIFRTYGGGSFSVIVPKMAKSAATMICFGAKSILMSLTSELGPVDPQVPIQDDAGRVTHYQAAHEVIEAYDGLMRKANTTRGRVEPYLQQLQRIDARDIRRIISAQKLAENITVKSLKSGYLSNLSEKEIRSKVKPFLDPQHTVSHGRPIYPELAKRCGLNVNVIDKDSDLWRSVWSLYIRLNHLVSATPVSRVVESGSTEYMTQFPHGGA